MLSILIILLNLHLCHQVIRADSAEESPGSPTTLPGPSAEDRETLKEALQLLNMGKQTMGLNTEDPELLMKLVDNANNSDKSAQIQKLLVEPPSQDFSVWAGKQYLALSGNVGSVKVVNFTNVTPDPGRPVPSGKNTNVNDVFKLVVEKKEPKGKEKILHKITIIETNQLKPYPDDKIFKSVGRKKRRLRSSVKRTLFGVPRKRRKRESKDHLWDLLRRKYSKQPFKVNVLQDSSITKTPKVENNSTSNQDFQLILTTKTYSDSSTAWSLIDYNMILLDKSKLGFQSPNLKQFQDNNIDLTFHDDNNTVTPENLMLANKPNSEILTKNVPKNNNFVANNILPRIKEEQVSNLEINVRKDNSMAVSDIFQDRIPQKLVYRPNTGTTLNSLYIDPLPVHFVKNNDLTNNDFDRTSSVLLDHYKFEKSLIEQLLNSNSRKKEREFRGLSFLEVVGIITIGALCFICAVLAYRRLIRARAPFRSLHESKAASKIKEQARRLVRRPSEKTARRNWTAQYYRTVATDEDNTFEDLEWQSEMGEWLPTDVEQCRVLQ